MFSVDGAFGKKHKSNRTACMAWTVGSVRKCKTRNRYVYALLNRRLISSAVVSFLESPTISRIHTRVVQKKSKFQTSHLQLLKIGSDDKSNMDMFFTYCCLVQFLPPSARWNLIKLVIFATIENSQTWFFMKILKSSIWWMWKKYICLPITVRFNWNGHFAVNTKA